MKALCFAVFSLLLALPEASRAQELSLAALNCQAANGGTLASKPYFAGSLAVEGRFAGIAKKYIGRIGEIGEGASRFLLLGTSGQVKLEVSARIDPTSEEIQSVPAFISFAGFPFMGVGATCEIQVERK